MCDARIVVNHDRRPICVRLSPAQVDEVVRAAAGGRAPSLSTLISKLLAAPLDREPAPGDPRAAEREPSLAGALPRDTEDSRLSRSLLRGLSLLSCFGPDGRERGIVEMAGELGMSPSTAHRYAVTLVELGLLERCPDSRKYRLPGI
jgi:DNA-binding IclR family transcriptional regulator